MHTAGAGEAAAQSSPNKASRVLNPASSTLSARIRTGDRTRRGNLNTQQDTQTIWIRNISKAGLCNESLLFPKQEQRGTKSSEEKHWNLFELAWSVIQKHESTESVVP